MPAVPALALVLGAAGLLAFGAVGAEETKSLVAPSSEPGGETVVAGYAGSYALVVGMSDYAPGTGWADLESVPGEVAKVERALRARGFEVVTHLDPDAEELEKAFEDFIESYGYDEDHRLLFYVSGHGYTLAGAGGRKHGFLAPTDAPNPLRDAKGFRRKALSMDQIVTWARQITARHALFLFDSCFSGTVFQTKALPDVPPHIGLLAGEPVRQFITAGSANEEVPARSVFTPAFVDALEHREGDLDGDGYVTGMELGMHLQAKVPRHAEQTPQFGKIQDYDLSRGDFVFRVGQPGVVPPPPPPPPPGEAARAYEAAERVGTVAAYRLVVGEFPGSIYAKLAEEQIDKLEEVLVVAGGDGAGDEMPPVVPDPAEVEKGLDLSREERRLIQMGLAATGHDPGPADGMIGSGTRGAIRRWQGSRREIETGYLDADGAKELLKLGRYLNEKKDDLDMIDKTYLIANYIFEEDYRDYSHNSNNFDGRNTEIKNRSLYLNGCYHYSGDDGVCGGSGYKAITNNLSHLNQTKFTVSVDFNWIDSDWNEGDPQDTILVGGDSYRWFAIRRRDNEISVAFNNGDEVFGLFDGIKINDRRWYRIICSVDILENKLHSILIDMDEMFIHTESVDLPDIELEIIEDKGFENNDRVFTFTNYSNGGVFHGYIRNFRIYSEALSLREMQLLHLKLRYTK